MFTVLFILSFIGILSLILVKVYELKRDRVTIVTKKLSQYDDKVVAHLEKLQNHYKRSTEKVSSVMEGGLLTKSKEVAIQLKNNSQKAYKSILPDVRGKRVFKSDKPASEFLKTISQDKEQNGGGRIEDNIISSERPTSGQ